MQMSTLARARETVFKTLGRWLTHHGGSIHDALALGTSPTLTCRGVLARIDIPASKEALITLPSDLFFTPHAASVCLQNTLSASSLEHIERMGGDSLTMAIALAHERARQQSSFWAPYIATLPKKPGPAWTLSAPEVAVQLKALGPAAHGWKRQIAALRETHTAASRRLSNAYGKQLGVGAADMMWALATVMSRCYVGEKVARLTPGLDLLNHGTQAWQLKGQRHLFTGRESMIARAEMQGSPCLLAAGDELLVDYGIGNDTKLMYLNYGFIDTKDIS